MAETIENANTKIVKTNCQFCPVGCGINVHLQGDKICKVEGMKEHPLNEGALCPKGRTIPEWVYSPDRLKYPMLKVDGKWKRITWDEAMNCLVEKLQDLRERYGARSVGLVVGFSTLIAGSSAAAIIRKFAHSYGTPSVFTVESLCYRVRLISFILTFGRYYVADLISSSLIVVWGHNPFNSEPPQAERILKAKQRGAKLVVIDPRVTATAKRADLHVQIRPGTDTALMLGMLNVIVNENLYDARFVDEWTVGFPELKSHVQKYSPEEVEKITWVKASTVRELARLFATQKPACIIQGTNSLDQTSTGVQSSRGVAILQAITGNLDVRGGFIRLPRFRTTPIEAELSGDDVPLGTDRFSLFCGVFGKDFGEAQSMVLPETILTEKPYPVKGLLVLGTNPLLTWPNSQKVKESFQKVGFLAVMDMFMSETAEIADLVLPAASFLERDELCDYYTLWGFPYVMLRKKVIQYEECRPDLEFLFDLARRMGYEKDFPWTTLEEFLDYVLAPSGETVQSLRAEKPSGFWHDEIREKYYLKEGFKTPSGKVELSSETLAGMGYDSMPTYYEPPESPVSRPDLFEQYPVILTTGARMLRFLHSQLRGMSGQRKHHPHAEAEVHPDTAAQYGIRDGEMGSIVTARGTIKIHFRLTTDILPGVVNVPHGWAEANVNILTNEASADPIVGYPALKALLCRIEPKNVENIQEKIVSSS